MTLRKALVASVAFVFSVSLADVADAAPNSKRAAAAAQSKSKKRDVPIKNPFGEMPKGPLQLVVSVGDQRVTLYSNGVRIAQAPVSTGTASHPTPFGVFSVIEKDRWHRSNIYDNAPMFYMQRLTWSGVAMHEGVLPGRPASHGCIRLPTDFASRLWVVTRLGVRIIVSRKDVAPYEFEHPKLFVPKPKPAQPPVAEVEQDKRAAIEPPIQLAWATPMKRNETISDAPPESALRRSVIETPPVVPPEPAGPVDSKVPAQTTAPAIEPVTESGTAVIEKPADVETTATVAPVVAPPAPPAPAPQAAELPPAGEQAKSAATAPASAEPDKPAANDAVPLPKPAPLRTKSAEPQKRTGQVAVFVSRKEKKIFVRQGFIPLFDMPVEIAELDKPLGTHVFTAMEFRDNGTAMRWNAITMPVSAEPPRPTAASKKNDNKKKAAAKAPPKPAPKPVEMKPPSTAAEALDRIQIPQEAIDRIGELLIPGSSLVVSDEGLGRETGRYTEFIVLTR